MKRVAVVTGGNKGIGFGVVKGLAKKFDGDVLLTSRDSEKGLKAVQSLKSDGLCVLYHPCDLLDDKSIVDLKNLCLSNYGGIDVLVNNAGIAFKMDATEPMLVQAEVTVGTNYWATKKACGILFPILKPGARVVNVSSSAGFLKRINGKEPEAEKLREQFSAPDLTEDQLDHLAWKYIEDVKSGDHFTRGWPNSTYSVSKVLLSALTRIQQRKLDEKVGCDLIVNHVHPGYVDTDMTSHKGPLTIDEGAVSTIYASLLPPSTTIKGEYIWKDCQIVDWVNGPTPTAF